MVNCKICGGSSTELTTLQVLGKYSVKYYQCKECEFIQTEDVFWLEEAYGKAITKLDIGLIQRNIDLSKLSFKIISQPYFDPQKKFLDYGGGYGMFVRLMRDKGFDFYRQDVYCDNIFAEYFDLSDLSKKEQEQFELLTAFEVFEHLVDPISEIKKMLTYSDSILFSTELQPSKNLLDWWYFVPETGQHVALYSFKSLQKIAEMLELNLYSNKANLHLLSRKKFATNPIIGKNLKEKLRFFVLKPLYRIWKDLSAKTSENKKTPMMNDFEYIKSKIKL